jgi:Skp family chaperone for outer membrane proteins
MTGKRAWFWVLAAAAAGFAVARHPGEAASTQEARGPFKLGVVNLKTCFQPDKFDRIKDVEEELKKTAEEYNKQVQTLDKRARELREQIEGLDRSQRLYEEKRRQIALVDAELKITREIGVQRLKGTHADLRREVYNEIERVIRMIGQEQKYDLILRVEQPQLEEQDEATLSMQIVSRVVLHHHESVDLTPVVLDRLTQEWKKQKAASPAAPAEWECPVCKKKNKGDACTATPGCKGKKP